MPKLNKFRVVNLVYNETRHIYDETFDFNEGNDTMMLLANGGGKTVLTQMMMQPVIPKTNLKKRLFADYFKKNKRPTLLISEWLMDGGTDKVLTGLVIKNQIRKKRGVDEDVETLRIYAFTIHYHYSKTYTIDSLPVTYRDGQGRKIMRDYEEIIKDLQKHANQFPEFVSLHHWSDSGEAKIQYGRRLAEFGIHQQEWKENILKINQEEAGLKSFYEEAKTSVTLIKRKILPTIESKLEEQARDKVEFQSLFRKHAAEQVKNKKIIEDEKTYHRFKSECTKLEEASAKHHQGLVGIQEKRDEALRVLGGLKILEADLTEALAQKESSINENRKMINIIRFEEDCFGYYKQKKEHDKRKLA